VTDDDGGSARVRDYALAVAMALIAIAFLAGAVSILWDVANNRTAMGVLWLPVGLGSAGWLCFLAWRRTVWGRPSAE
jgi:hypothetical protein